MIRMDKAQADDAEPILALQKLAYQSEAELYDDFTIPPLRQTLEEMVRDIQTQHVLKACKGDQIVGSVRAMIKEDACAIGRLIVHPDYQRQGLGTRLMNEIETLFSDAGRFTLFTGHKSDGNIRLYQRLGYAQTHTTKVNDRLTLVFLEKKVQPTS